MRRFIFQTVVNVIALLGVLFIITLLSVMTGNNVNGTTLAQAFSYDAAILLGVVLLGIIITVVNWYVRPLLVMFFGGWVIRSFGLFIILLDAFLFFVAVWLNPVNYRIASPQWFWIVFAAVLFNVLSFVIGILVGVNRPALGVKRNAEFWKQLERLPSFRRSSITENLRLQEVYSTLLNFGLEIALADTAIGRFRIRMSRFVFGTPNPVDDMTTPVKVRVMLQQLGPTYVKFGQMASAESQTLPPDFIVELPELQSNVPPVPYEQACEVILRELGKPPEERLYASFEHEAMAAASTAQVHHQTLEDGTRVAVKVQRPNIVAMVKADLGILQDVSGVLEGISDYARDLDLSGIVTEFADGVIRELDYRNEAYHARRLADNMSAFPLVQVPTMYVKLSAERVLTMEFISGVALSKPGALDGAAIDRTELTETFMRALIKQIFIDGFFHADPHPGNIFVNPATGVLTYLDLGLVGKLDQTKRLDLIDLLVSVNQNDSESIANLGLRLSKKTRPVDATQFRNDMSELLKQYMTYSANPSFDSLISQFFGLLQQYGLRLDKQFTLAIKSVVQSQSVVQVLGGQLDIVTFAVAEIQKLALAEFTQDKVIGTVKQQVTAVGKELLRRVPTLQDATVSWLDQYMAGKFVVHVDTSDLSQHVDELGTTFSKLTAGLIITGMIVGTAIVTSQIWQFEKTDQFMVAVLAVIVFILVLGIGGVMVWRLLRPRRRTYIE